MYKVTIVPAMTDIEKVKELLNTIDKLKEETVIMRQTIAVYESVNIKPKEPVVNYEKVDNCDKGDGFPILVQQLIDGNDIYSHNLATDGKDIITSFDMLLEAYRLNNIYRKVEITPMQAAKNACKASRKNHKLIVHGKGTSLFEMFEYTDYDSYQWDNEFIELCRTIINAYDNQLKEEK